MQGDQMGATLSRGLSPKGRANNSGFVRIDSRRHLYNFACRRGHQLPGLDYNKLPVGIPKMPENPDRLGLAVRRGENREMVDFRQRETGFQIRVYDGSRNVVGLRASKYYRVQGNRSHFPVVEIAKGPG